jgi:hypothetical protein
LRRAHGLADSLECSRVRLRALAACRETLRVAAAAIGLDVLQSLDVRGHFATEFTFDRQGLNLLADLTLLVGRKVGRMPSTLDSSFVEDRACA